MFDVFCPNHGSRVLLFSDDIEALINHPDGIALHWHCPCGERGVTVIPVSRRGTNFDARVEGVA